MEEISLKAICSLDFAELTEVDQYFALARAYLNASCVLSNLMLRPEVTSDYANTRVILHLCRQAVELFLKGTILGVTRKRYNAGKDKNGFIINSHNLVPLMTKYRSVLPEQRFHFEMPFGFETIRNCEGYCNDKLMSAESYHELLDQRHRYPADRKGHLFTTDFSIDSFTPATYLAKLEELADVFALVEEHLGRRVS